MTVCFAALGDSITAGLGDGVSMSWRHRPQWPGRGWAAALTPHLAPAGTARLLNLATSGATVADVRAVQLPAALAARPQVASVVAGMNDVLRAGLDPGALHDDLAVTVDGLRGAGATVLMARLPDPGRVLGLPGPLRRPLLRRLAAVDEVTRAVAARPGVLLLDIGGHPEAYERTSWDVDRIHPSGHGHRLLARAFAELLAGAGVPLAGLPEVGPSGRPPSTAAHVRWLVTNGAPWMALRLASPPIRRVVPPLRSRTR